MSNNWAETYIAKQELKEEKRIKDNNKTIEEAEIIEESKVSEVTKTWDEFLALEIKLQGRDMGRKSL